MLGELEVLTQPWDGMLRPIFFRVEDMSKLPVVDADPVSVSVPAHAAYVIYTSGSTGVPKGAVIEHLGMLNHLYAKVKDLGLRASDVIAQTASQCFDISVWQFLAPLVVGGRVVIFPDAIAADPEELFDHTISQKVTILETVPSLLRAGLEEIDSGRMPAPVFANLRWLLLTGEALPPELVRRWLQHYRDIAIVNAYGPTECSDDVAHHVIQAEKDGAYTPIGVPIINTQLHVLDGQMAPVPVGIPGELYVGGSCVGRGYLLDPVRTAQVFVPDPFATHEGARLYRTGDLVRRLPGGELVFLHRTDHQIKMRGFRIELGEIEAALERHPDVLQAAVLMYEEERQGSRLVAYVAARDGLEGSVLRESLQQQLPDYMVPSAFVVLRTLPLTANGKLDRKALPAPPRAEHVVIAPRNLMEAKLVEIWEQVLAINSVGVNEDFFQIGGHSLIAVRMMAMIRNRFQKALPLASLFQNPTIAGLAKLLAGPGESDPSRIVVAIQPEGTGTPFFCVHPVGGGVLCYVDLARALGQDRPFYGLQSPPPGSLSEPLPSVQDMAALYIQEIRRVQPKGPYLLGGWSVGGLIATEMGRQLVQDGECVRSLILFDTHPPQSHSFHDHADSLPVLALFAADMSRLLGRDPGDLREQFLHLSPKEQESWILRILKEEGVLPQEAPEQELHAMMSIFARNSLAAENYSLGQYTDHIVFFQAADSAPQSLIEEWKAATGSTVDLHTVPGDHYTMLKRPHVIEVAERMKRYFEEKDTERALTMDA
jgi:amino acid adenylation domain-containing protein